MRLDDVVGLYRALGDADRPDVAKDFMLSAIFRDRSLCSAHRPDGGIVPVLSDGEVLHDFRGAEFYEPDPTDEYPDLVLPTKTPLFFLNGGSQNGVHLLEALNPLEGLDGSNIKAAFYDNGARYDKLREERTDLLAQSFMLYSDWELRTEEMPDFSHYHRFLDRIAAVEGADAGVQGLIDWAASDLHPR